MLFSRRWPWLVFAQGFVLFYPATLDNISIDWLLETGDGLLAYISQAKDIRTMPIKGGDLSCEEIGTCQIELGIK